MHNVKKSVDALGNINSYIVKKYMVVGNIGPRIWSIFSSDAGSFRTKTHLES